MNHPKVEAVISSHKKGLLTHNEMASVIAAVRHGETKPLVRIERLYPKSNLCFIYRKDNYTSKRGSDGKLLNQSK